MSPLSKNIKKNALTAAAALLFFCGTFLNGCGNDGKSSRPVEAYEGGTASVAFEISGEEPPGIDSLVITAEGPDSLRIKKTALGETAEFSLRPAETWKITAKLYANGLLAEKGELELSNVQAGETRTATIELKAVTGYLYVQIPLGLKNPAGIKAGSLTISKNGKAYETDSLVIGNVYATFTSKALDFGTAYGIRMAIFGSGADTLYTFDSTFTLTRDNPFPALELKSLRGSASVTFKMDAILPSKQAVAYLKSAKRSPRKGDIIITEFMPSSGVSKVDSLFRFVELYNGTLDTLILTDCALAKKTSTTPDSSLNGKAMLPASFFIIGGDSMTLANARDSMAKMTIATKSLVFSCSGAAIDSLRYEAADSVAIDKGKSIQLPLKKWASKSDWKSWCASGQPFSLQGHTFYGTPGADAVCE